MDKKLIERIALEVAKDLVFPGFEIDAVMASALTKYAGAFLARIDAERGKGAVATKLATDNPFSCFKVSLADSEKLAALPAGTKLFLSPTIPEGMALAPTTVTPAIQAVLEEMLAYCRSFDEVYRDLLAAAKGECNADC